MAQSLPEMKCKSCGAPIPYVSGENVLNCGYCGSTMMVASLDNIVKVEEHSIIPNTLNADAVQQHCRKWMGEGFFKAGDLPKVAVFGKIEPLFLPFWVVNVQVDTHWSGMNSHTRTVGSGNNTRTETYWTPDSGSFHDKLGWTVYARGSLDEYYGLAALNPGALETSADWGGSFFKVGLGDKESKGIDLVTGKKPFSADYAKDIKILNGQITQEQANERAKSQVLNFHRKQASKKVQKLTDCDTNIQMERTELVYAPLWFVEYNYKGKIYHMLLEGHAGRVIAGEAPVGKWDKVAVSGAISAAAAIACAAGAYYTKNNLFLIGSAIAILVVGIHAIKTALSK